MTLVPRYHDLENKRILNNEILPAAPSTPNDYRTETTAYVDPQTGENAYDSNGIRDLDAVLDALFNHPNTPPLICRQLIQRLVTSHPSNGYVYRVVQAFTGERNVDGVATGVRGDLKEVTRAILLDPERGPRPRPRRLSLASNGSPSCASRRRRAIWRRRFRRRWRPTPRLVRMRPSAASRSLCPRAPRCP